MPQILSLSLRPRRLSDLIGQEAMVKALRNQMAKRPPQTFMFWGSTGVGKTTIARILAVAFQCTHQQPGLWGDPCAECWKRRSTFAIHEINASDVSGVEELGKVAQLSRFRSMESAKRVIILDEFQKATNSAQNLLLKPFEEPPPGTIWIVLTTEPQKILPTLRRRCTTYLLKGLSIDDQEKMLRNAAAATGIARDLKPLFEAAHEQGVTSPALLLMALEKYAAGMGAKEAASGTDGGTVDSLRICKAVTSGDWPTLQKNLKDMTPDDSRFVRASVIGWIKGCLLRESSVKHASSLVELTAPAPLEDNLLMPWLLGVLWKICARYRS